MIGNRYSVGSQGYTILEEGRINRETLALDVEHYLVCRPNGDTLARTFASRADAEAEIQRLEAAQ